MPDEAPGWEGWEDAAVTPEKLGGYLRDLFRMMQGYGYRSALYGHFGHACVHMRINFDLQSRPGIANYRKFVEEAADLVVSYGGSLSGEHGDGQSRAELLPKMFGPALIQAFREFKALWDPDWKMNPERSSSHTGWMKICAWAPTTNRGHRKPTSNFPKTMEAWRTLHYVALE